MTNLVKADRMSENFVVMRFHTPTSSTELLILIWDIEQKGTAAPTTTTGSPTTASQPPVPIQNNSASIGATNIVNTTRFTAASPASVEIVTEPLDRVSNSEATLSLNWLPGDPYSLAVGTGFKWLRIYDIRGNSRPTSVVAHAQSVNGVSFDPFNPMRLSTFSEEGTVKIWDLRMITRKEIFSIPSIPVVSNSRTPKTLIEVSWCPTAAHRIATSHRDEGGLRLWDLSDSLPTITANMVSMVGTSPIGGLGGNEDSGTNLAEVDLKTGPSAQEIFNSSPNENVTDSAPSRSIRIPCLTVPASTNPSPTLSALSWHPSQKQCVSNEALSSIVASNLSFYSMMNASPLPNQCFGCPSSPSLSVPAPRLVGVELNPGPSDWQCQWCRHMNSAHASHCSNVTPSTAAAGTSSRCPGVRPTNIDIDGKSELVLPTSPVDPNQSKPSQKSPVLCPCTNTLCGIKPDSTSPLLRRYPLTHDHYPHFSHLAFLPLGLIPFPHVDANHGRFVLIRYRSSKDNSESPINYYAKYYQCKPQPRAGLHTLPQQNRRGLAVTIRQEQPHLWNYDETKSEGAFEEETQVKSKNLLIDVDHNLISHPSGLSPSSNKRRSDRPPPNFQFPPDSRERAQPFSCLLSPSDFYSLASGEPTTSGKDKAYRLLEIQLTASDDSWVRLDLWRRVLLQEWDYCLNERKFRRIETPAGGTPHDQDQCTTCQQKNSKIKNQGLDHPPKPPKHIDHTNEKRKREISQPTNASAKKPHKKQKTQHNLNPSGGPSEEDNKLIESDHDTPDDGPQDMEVDDGTELSAIQPAVSSNQPSHLSPTHSESPLDDQSNEYDSDATESDSDHDNCSHHPLSDVTRLKSSEFTPDDLIHRLLKSKDTQRSINLSATYDPKSTKMNHPHSNINVATQKSSVSRPPTTPTAATATLSPPPSIIQISPPIIDCRSLVGSSPAFPSDCNYGPVNDMIPIFICSKGRSLTARLTSTLGTPTELSGRQVFVFIEPNERDQYLQRTDWMSQHRLVLLPLSRQGIGFVRYFMQFFASQLGFHRYWQLDDNITGMKSQPVLRSNTISVGSTCSVMTALRSIESLSTICHTKGIHIGMMGFPISRPINGDYLEQSRMNRFVQKCVLIDVDFTIRRGIHFDSRFTVCKEDVNFYDQLLRAYSLPGNQGPIDDTIWATLKFYGFAILVLPRQRSGGCAQAQAEQKDLMKFDQSDDMVPSSDHDAREGVERLKDLQTVAPSTTPSSELPPQCHTVSRLLCPLKISQEDILKRALGDIRKLNRFCPSASIASSSNSKQLIQSTSSSNSLTSATALSPSNAPPSLSTHNSAHSLDEILQMCQREHHRLEVEAKESREAEHERARLEKVKLEQELEAKNHETAKSYFEKLTGLDADNSILLRPDDTKRVIDSFPDHSWNLIIHDRDYSLEVVQLLLKWIDIDPETDVIPPSLRHQLLAYHLMEEKKSFSTESFLRGVGKQLYRKLVQLYNSIQTQPTTDSRINQSITNIFMKWKCIWDNIPISYKNIATLPSTNRSESESSDQLIKPTPPPIDLTKLPIHRTTTVPSTPGTDSATSTVTTPTSTTNLTPAMTPKPQRKNSKTTTMSPRQRMEKEMKKRWTRNSKSK